MILLLSESAIRAPEQSSSKLVYGVENADVTTKARNAIQPPRLLLHRSASTFMSMHGVVGWVL